MDYQTCSLGGSGLTRAPRIKAKYWEDDYLDRFDADTLWLDAVKTRTGVTLITPRLSNLSNAVRKAEFRVDGRLARVRHQKFYRHETFHLLAEGPCRSVSIRIGDWVGETGVSPDENAEFAGRNAVMLISKDNELDWIRDFVRFHVHHHGADAIVLADNGSSAYSTGDIEEAVRQAGAKAVRILSAPTPFGPRGKKPYANTELYLQTMLANTHRIRFLSQARAVLVCDLDELVLSDRSIFDMTVASRIGYLRFAGDWRYMPPGSDASPTHGAHRFALTGEKRCPPKWCVAPTGPMRRFSWSTHGLEGVPMNDLIRTRHARFAHCRSITTGWKRYQGEQTPPDVVPDADLAQALNDAGLA